MPRIPESRPAGGGRPSGSKAAESYAVLSILAAVVTLGLKVTAFLLTGSVGLLSDAAESIVNLLAAVVALWALRLAYRPADEGHVYGHTKAEYFSSALESALILMAGAGIAWAAWRRLLHPQPLTNLEAGLGLAALAAIINGVVAWRLMSASRRLGSITLRADAHHLLTDVWTTAGVLAGVGLIRLTGWLVIDPLIGLALAVNIGWTAVRLLRDTAAGVLDAALPGEDQARIKDVLDSYLGDGAVFHALRTRIAGRRRFVSLHVLVPGGWSVRRGHDLCERVEIDLVRALPGATIFTHLEPVEDSASWGDEALDRRMPEDRTAR